MKKIIALLLTLAMVCSLSAVSVLAVSFPDVTSPTYDWASKEIEDMVSKGYIKGYPDSTFRPAQAITKIEALILSARILGYTDADNKFFTSLATSLYKEVLADYDFDYKGEVSYLLYKGILSKSDLEDYVEASVINTPLTRYEAAVILTLICGAEGELSDTATKLPFTDAKDAPNWTLPYIEYVYESGLMKGVSDTAFDPKGSVTRAQISVMLYRAMEALDLLIDVGTITKVSAGTYALSYENADGDVVDVTVPKAADIVIDGIHGRSMAQLFPSMTVAVIRSGNTIISVESVAPEIDGEVCGTIVSLAKSLPGKMVIKADGKENTFTVSAGAAVMIDGKESTYAKLEKSQYVTCALAGDSIVSIDAESLTKTVSGTVTQISYDPVLTFTITDSDDISLSFVPDDDVTVKRNGKTSTLRDVLVGDSVKITLRNNLIYSVTATGEKDTVSGTIVGIHITTTPSIDVKTDKGVVTYALNQNTAYKLGTSNATIYDLRLNATVKLSLDSDTVLTVSATSIGTSVQITGTVADTFLSYNFINVVTDAGQTYQVFLTKDTTIIDGASGKTLKNYDIEKADTVTVFGSHNTGIIDAATIVIQ